MGFNSGFKVLRNVGRRTVSVTTRKVRDKKYFSFFGDGLFCGTALQSS